MSKKSGKRKKNQTKPDAAWFKPWADRYAIVMLLAVVLFCRPLIDGIVWPVSNHYFGWAMCFVFAIWAARTVLTGQTVRAGLPLILFGIYALIALGTVFSTIRVDLTYAALPVLAVSIMSLMLGTNIATSEPQRRVILGALLAVCLVQALYGIYHVVYILPQARAVVNTNPALVEQLFPGGVIGPELRNRLESNRAFGTFLFPNAFSAFLILGLPIAIATGMRAFISKEEETTTEVLPDKPKDWPASAKLTAVSLFGAIFVTVLIGAEFLVEYALRSDFTGDSALRSGFVRYSLSLGGAAALAIVPPVLGSRLGLRRARIVITKIAAPIIAIILMYGVYSSGTRGALLGIAAAIAFTGGIYLLRRFGARRIGATAVAAVLMLSAIAALAPSDAFAQDGINIEGRGEDPTIMRYFSAIYRVHYWRVAFRVFSDHVFGGVGIGAYESAIHKYMYMGAAFAHMVHNDFLQAFAETGLFGGLAFTGFWVFFTLMGARAMYRSKDVLEFLHVAGPFTGCLAFAMHQLVDFGFQNPSLTLPLYTIAGLTLAPIATRELSEGVSKSILIASLIFAAVVAGWISRVYVGEQQLASLGNRELRYAAADFLLLQTEDDARRNKPFSATATTTFIGSSNQLKQIGFFGVPTEVHLQYRQIPTSNVLPNNAAFFVDDWKAGQDIAWDATLMWIDRYKEVDAKYPHSPDLALDIRLLYVRLYHATDDPQEKMAIANECLEWAYTQLKREPYSGNAMLNVAWSHRMIAVSFEDEDARIQGLIDSLEKFRAAIDLSPAEPFIYYQYGEQVKWLIEALDGSDPELIADLQEKYEWADSQEKLALKKSPFSLTGETHADILRKWPELEPTR